ncbi:hypothetical protein, partial [Bifidobacterium merycicum]|uniref:hypothetical protein n=1 Tax=Bifidobacterium merycicum TaxID=78345 RepID=UPI001F2CFCE0
MAQEVPFIALSYANGVSPYKVGTFAVLVMASTDVDACAILGSDIPGRPSPRPVRRLIIGVRLFSTAKLFHGLYPLDIIQELFALFEV